ncbi:MAG: PSD1 and planctomycete cytochrome C domain-containing protein [Fuerstiella sp.]|nr:PSD1 and planctomycete cytochrome C domain-containing protein [Fuerstiella sp.]
MKTGMITKAASATFMFLALWTPVVVQSEIRFERDVYGLLRKSCFECHGDRKQEGDLRLDSREYFLQSETVVPGQPAESELFRRVALPAGHDEIMPAIGEPLKVREIRILLRWIEAGAEWPADFQVQTHWAYVAPERPTPPGPDNTDWARNPIDQFVLARLQRESMGPSAEAPPETRIRRAFFDVIGLPPTPEEIRTFIANPSDDAYETIVDELLQRPQFGERWARPWLDLARYADSHGFQRDNLRQIWAYRDWVIQALNEDMPFDRFTIEQIAGDLLPNPTEAQRIATGFHRCTPTNVEAGSLPEETRLEQVIDRVNTTGAVWLGTTLECAQCHDHKYDPFTAKDYYQLLAYFNSTEAEADRANPKTPSSIAFRGPKMPLTNPQKDAQRKLLQDTLTALRSRRDQRRKTLAGSLQEWSVELAATVGEQPQTHAMQVVDFKSLGATDTHELLDDGSILLVGNDPPDRDTYTVAVTTNQPGISAIRLDVLTHDSLPGTGPGRGDATRTNFVLNRVSATVSETNGETARVLEFDSAVADFEQTNWDVNGVFNYTKNTGWAIAPKFGKPHWARFMLKEPLDVSESTTISFTLKHDYGGARSIGRFRLSAVTGNVDAETVPAEIIAALTTSPEKWTKQQTRKLLDYRAKLDMDTKQIVKQIAKVNKQIAAVVADTTLVMIELEQPRTSYIFERGDYRSHGEPVQAGTPQILHASVDGPPNRLTLAKWLVDRRNPLVARVTVNRWWAEIFGHGIVATVEDFGVKGDAPSHPELLDWLAVEFMENDWSMKKLLRTILLSATYRQASIVTPDLQQHDDLNRLLARGPRFRMDAEMIRDNILAASGLISLKQFGPSIRPYQPDGIWSKVGGTAYSYEVSPDTDKYRRGLYVVLKRGAPYPSFINFDASARLACTVKRSRSNTPLQALTLLNDPVYVEAAGALARRVLNQRSMDDVDRKIDYMFQLCTARMPSVDERNTLRDLLETQISINNASGTKPTNPSDLPAGVSEFELAAWQNIASTVINLHETITKN